MLATPDAIDAELARLEHAVGDNDGLGLIRAVLGSPLGKRIALVSSFGTESAVLLDMVASVDPGTTVIFLDTGKLFPETLAYCQQLCALLGLTNVRHVGPDPASVERYDAAGTLHKSDPDFCCHLRKTEPLDAVLDGYLGWITGRKRFQGGARADLPLIEREPATGRIKVNPLAHWTLEDIRHYRRLRNLPLHPLVPKGYASVGCAPCTSPIRPGEPPRAGRWRGLDKLECGIHRR